MAITNMGSPNGASGARFDFIGLSSDTKPTENIEVNSLFFELDTGDAYYFDGSDWARVGG